MKTCYSEYCEPCCDFCIHYRAHYDVDEHNQYSGTGFGECLVRRETVCFDWGCGEFYCLIAWRSQRPTA